MALPDSEIAQRSSDLCQQIVNHHVFFTPKENSDWESCPELPTPEEIMMQQKEAEGVPPNPVDKKWASKADYLEAQYKILRREGVEGLRYSVRCYMEACAKGQEMTDDHHTAIYVGVRVRSYLMSRLGPIARIEFSTARSPLQIKWLQSKRLTPGTTVAITTKADNFRTICKIATIAQRPYKDGLDQNPPVVDLMWADPKDAVFDPRIELVMIESRSGYFESTRHTLVGLQHAAQGSSSIDKYLTGNHNKDRAPEFVRNGPGMNLATLVHIMPEDADQSYKDIVDPLRDYDVVKNGLPNLDGLTTLDESQLKGLQRMLSTELSIVQGPPGTGKTFTSVEALKVMVATRRRHGGPPVIVAAQTNHALDQLLAHCYASGAKICRVGARTESDVIRPHTVYEIRQREGGGADKRHKNLYLSRVSIEKRIKGLVDSVFGDSLLKPAALLGAGIITQKQFDSLTDDTMETSDRMKELGPFGLWLGDCLIPAEIIENRYPTQQEVDDAEDKMLADWELDEDIENIADDEEDAFRIEGELIPLSHVWTGKEPDTRKWERRCIRELAECDDMFDIDPALRGGVYQQLQAKLVQALTPQFSALLVEHHNICNTTKAHRWYRDAQMLEKADIDIIGCTTTGLTKYRGLVAALRPTSLLIEEAAETREANITAAIYPTVQQLILVGDHQQLAPRCDIRWLGEEPYNLNVSMFQRMVNLEMPFVMLSQQRRMKPEIRRIVSPFYPDLVDHPEVLLKSKRPDVPGMGGRNCWYFDHSWPEATNSEMSKYNETEADMIVRFFAYLVANGTDPSLITILTFYKGQRKLLLNRLRKEGSMRLPGGSFRVSTVDSYQGEENDIVILSLVRSPFSGQPSAGFLADQRRAVVAISRARRGFYVFGNITNLLSAERGCYLIWGNIWNGFAEQGRVKRALGLPLICQNHGNETWVKEVDDWADNAGGCDQQCNEIRPCGHACTLKCHITDHERLPCSVPCRNTLECGHGCERFCGKVCHCQCNKFRDIIIARETEKARLAAKVNEEEEVELSFEERLARDLPEVAFLQAAAGRNNSGTPSRGLGGLPQPDIAPLAAHRNETSPRKWITGIPEEHDDGSPEKWNNFTVNIKEHDAMIHQESRLLAKQAGTPTKIQISDTYSGVALVDGRRTKNQPRSTQQIEMPFKKTTVAAARENKLSPPRQSRSRGAGRSRIRAAKPHKGGKKSPAGSGALTPPSGDSGTGTPATSPTDGGGGGTPAKTSSSEKKDVSTSRKEENLLSLEDGDMPVRPIDLLTGMDIAGLETGNMAHSGSLPTPGLLPEIVDVGNLLIDFGDLQM
ncbi:P-loop containing nucleoside triphosphate hydrolase protein [Naviculisporaceae sp. PSN 640]